MRPFLVNVADLVHRPGARRRERVSAPLGPLVASGAEVPGRADVTVDTLLEWVSEGVLATGTVAAPWRGQCRRCLGEVGGEAVVEFRELFEERPREGETYLLRADHVDLEPLAREAVMLELPLAPLCAESCAGLCATCGADLNRGPCSCPAAAPDSRWASLDALRWAAEPPPTRTPWAQPSGESEGGSPAGDRGPADGDDTARQARRGAAGD